MTTESCEEAITLITAYCTAQDEGGEWEQEMYVELVNDLADSIHYANTLSYEDARLHLFCVLTDIFGIMHTMIGRLDIDWQDMLAYLTLGG